MVLEHWSGETSSLCTFHTVGTSLRHHFAGHTSKIVLVLVQRFWPLQGVQLTEHHEELTGHLVQAIGAVQVATGYRDHLRSTIYGTAHRSQVVTGSTAPTSSWWLCWNLVFLAVSAGQPGPVSRAASVSGLGLLLASTACRLPSNLEAMSVCRPQLYWSRLLGQL